MKLTIGGYGPEKSAHGHGLSVLAERLRTGSQGELEVDVIWNIMDLGRPNTDLFDLVERGEMFICYFSTSYQGHRVPELNVIETPYLFKDLAHAHRSLDGTLGATLKEATRRATDFEIVGFWDNGFRHMTNHLHPIHSPGDMAGMTVRMQPNRIHEELIRAWGAEPIAIDLKPAVEMISRLEVDAQENPLANSVAYGVEKVHKFFTMTGHLYGSRGLFANRSVYEGLDDDLRAVVDQAVSEAVAAQRAAAAEYELELRRRLESTGQEFVDLSDEEDSVFRDRAQPAIDMAQRGLPEELFELVADE